MIRMEDNAGDDRVMCLGCFTVQKADFEAPLILCSSCKYEVTSDAYKHVFRLAEEAIQLGYIYRKTYEEQERKQGQVSALYALNPPEGWMVWTTLAILGGVAGNLAYDAMKAAILSIYKRYSSSKRRTELPLGSDQEFEIIVEYVRDYAVGMPTATAAVKAAVAQEWLADRTSIIMPDLSNHEDIIEALQPVIRQAIEEMKNRRLIVDENLPPIGINYKKTADAPGENSSVFEN